MRFKVFMAVKIQIVALRFLTACVLSEGVTHIFRGSYPYFQRELPIFSEGVTHFSEGVTHFFRGSYPYFHPDVQKA